MSLGVIVDVAIGLALTYLLLALVAAAAQETVATVLSWRGKQLRDGLTSLLAGKGPVTETAALLASGVHGHALVQATSGNGLPSYVTARSFSGALFDVLTHGSQAPVFSQIEASVVALPPCPARQSLTALITQAGGDVDALRNSVEAWFNDAMDRLSGDYKRYSHYFALAFGLVVAIAFNVDTMQLARTLWNDPAVRAAYVAVATKYVNQDTPGANADSAALQQRAQDAAKALATLPGPIGWQVQDKETLPGAFCRTVFSLSGIWVILGWIITALAVSLGAPFWFDILQKLFSLRGTGPKPGEPGSSSATP